MAAQVALSRADVTVRRHGADDVVHADVSVVVRNGTGTLRQRSTEVAALAGVTSSQLLGRGHWLVTFDDGTTWDVHKAKCAPCGQR